MRLNESSKSMACVEVKYIEAVKITIYSAVEVTEVVTSDIATSFSQDSMAR